MIREQQYSDQELTALLGEATYHLGRVLYEGALDFDGAVSELEKAIRLRKEIKLDSDNTAAYYYLGQAIRRQIEESKSKRAREVLREYLSRGTPLGHEDEVREFLGSRKQAAERQV
jgi:hypothetical protein